MNPRRHFQVAVLDVLYAKFFIHRVFRPSILDLTISVQHTVFSSRQDIMTKMANQDIMNTRISYQYRDVSNYKLFNEVVIEGELEFSELEPF
ncbi:MAG TPA: hypothetical protein DCG57_08950 [Candidatus Riflebacteria bacterium]|nr:hypothetical protein [Candidatus Riflebacteria bacterium]